MVHENIKPHLTEDKLCGVDLSLSVVKPMCVVGLQAVCVCVIKECVLIWHSFVLTEIWAKAWIDHT